MASDTNLLQAIFLFMSHQGWTDTGVHTSRLLFYTIHSFLNKLPRVPSQPYLTLPRGEEAGGRGGNNLLMKIKGIAFTRRTLPGSPLAWVTRACPPHHQAFQSISSNCIHSSAWSSGNTLSFSITLRFYSCKATTHDLAFRSCSINGSHSYPRWENRQWASTAGSYKSTWAQMWGTCCHHHTESGAQAPRRASRCQDDQQFWVEYWPAQPQDTPLLCREPCPGQAPQALL